MTNQKHLITPPPKLVEQWVSLACEYEGNGTWIDLATEAARWGADEELKACCKWADETGWTCAGDVLRDARRPKPPNLNKVALQMLGTIERDGHYLPEITDTIRCALKAQPK